MSKKFLSVILVITMAVCLLPTMRGSAEDYTISNALFVTAGTLGISQDMLQWSNVNAPGGYKLEIYTESGTQVYSGTLAVNYIPASEVLTASGTYYFTVYALDLNGSKLSSKTSDKFTYTHTHSLVNVETKEASCTEAGNSEYWYCSVCEGYFSDAGATAKISQSSTVIAATGHQNVTHTEAEDPTCTEAGNIEYWYCSDCGKYFSDSNYETVISQSDTVIAAIAHKNAEKVAAVDATCTTAGNIEYWYCSDCKCYFSDADCTQEITQAETITSALGHTLQHFEAVEAGCDTVGNVEYWYCGDCDTYFSDADATAEITLSQTVVAATGKHEYEVSAIVWNYEDGTATVKCLECGEYHAFDATVTSKNVLGQKTYTITTTINGTEYTDTKTTGTSLMMVQASYNAVTAAIEKANSLNPDDYEDFTPVTDAINAVDWSLSVLNQNQVNSYAEAIEEAIENLVPVSTTEEVVEIEEPVEAGETDME